MATSRRSEISHSTFLSFPLDISTRLCALLTTPLDIPIRQKTCATLDVIRNVHDLFTVTIISYFISIGYCACTTAISPHRPLIKKQSTTKLKTELLTEAETTLQNIFHAFRHAFDNPESHGQRKSTHKLEVEWVLEIVHSSLQTKTNPRMLLFPKSGQTVRSKRPGQQQLRHKRRRTWQEQA